MEEQASPAPTYPPTNRCETWPAQPTPTSPPTPPPFLSSSEHFLRFPRPQGNRRLASWISASDPDIMRLTTAAEDTGLADSTYELIAGTDSESQDGNFTESMGDSLSSLDPHRSDDVHSLDGTEYTHDGESVDDDADALPHAASSEGLGETINVESQQVDVGETNDTLVAQDHDLDGPEVSRETFSRSSLEYTHHSLGTPSILTPDVNKPASSDLDHPGQPSDGKPGNPQAPFNMRLAHLWPAGARVNDSVVKTALETLSGALFTAAAALLVLALYKSTIGAPRPPPSAVHPTITATTTLTAVSTRPPFRVRTPTTGGMDLIPLSDGSSDDWLFAARKPSISFTPKGHTDILVHIPRDIKKIWLARDCLAVRAVRDDRQIETFSSSVDEGILLKFLKKEAHGVVNLSLEATCRPRLLRMVKVYFGKGAMEEALEMTRNLVLDLSGLVPAFSQQAERYLARARRSFDAVSDSVSGAFVSASFDFVDRTGHALSRARDSLAVVKADAQSRVAGAHGDIAKKLGAISQQANGQLKRMQEVRSQLQSTLLDAQISAKLWWLKSTARKEDHDDYQRKAIKFVAKKRAAAKDAVRARPHRGCQRRRRRGGRSTHKCRADN